MPDISLIPVSQGKKGSFTGSNPQYLGYQGLLANIA